jgi:hypothetical protein
MIAAMQSAAAASSASDAEATGEDVPWHAD